MGVTNRQVEISGEILATTILNTSTATTKALTSTHSTVSGLEVTFTPDRTGNAEIYCQIYIDKTTSGGTKHIYGRLVDSSNSEISNTDIEVMHMHSSDGGQMLNCSWIVSMTKGTAQTIKVQLRYFSDGQTINAVYGGDYAPAILKAIGL